MDLTLAKAALLSTQSEVPSTKPVSFSIASFKCQALNEHLLDLFTAMFDLEPTLIKSHPNSQTLLNYRTLAT
jgi:hypothetical protein